MVYTSSHNLKTRGTHTDQGRTWFGFPVVIKFSKTKTHPKLALCTKKNNGVHNKISITLKHHFNGIVVLGYANQKKQITKNY